MVHIFTVVLMFFFLPFMFASKCFANAIYHFLMTFLFLDSKPQGDLVSFVGLGRISDSAGLSGRISGYPARIIRISGNINNNPSVYLASGEKKTDIRPNPILVTRQTRDWLAWCSCMQKAFWPAHWNDIIMPFITGFWATHLIISIYD